MSDAIRQRQANRKSYYKHHVQRKAINRQYGQDHKEQRSKYGRQWGKKNQIKISEQAKLPQNRRRSRNTELRITYGIDHDEYDRMLASQHGTCAVCNSLPKAFRAGGVPYLFVDHDHMSGRVRGLLCRNCNFALGFARDDVVMLTNLIDYLNANN